MRSLRLRVGGLGFQGKQNSDLGDTGERLRGWVPVCNETPAERTGISPNAHIVFVCVYIYIYIHAHIHTNSVYHVRLLVQEDVVELIRSVLSSCPC